VYRIQKVQNDRIGVILQNESICILNHNGTREQEWNINHNINNTHNFFYTSLLQLRDGRFVLGMANGMVEVWSDGACCWRGAHCNNFCIIGANANSNVTWLIQLQDGRVASSNIDICIWNFGDMSKHDGQLESKCDLLLDGHRGYVNRFIQLTDGRILSVSMDQTIRIWKLDGNCEHVFGCDLQMNNVIQLQDGQIFVSGNSILSYIYDLHGLIHKKIQHCTNFRRATQIEDGRIVYINDHKQILCCNSYSYQHEPLNLIGEQFLEIHTKEDVQEGRQRLYKLLQDYIHEDVKSIVFQYVKPL
jgi:hypothetical protein